MDLKSCPFCDRNDLCIVKISDEEERTYALAVQCRDCLCRGRYCYPIGWVETEQEARQAWNDRESVPNYRKEKIMEEFNDFVLRVNKIVERENNGN